MKLAERPSFDHCRVAPRLAPYFLVKRQESRQRNVPRRLGPAGYPALQSVKWPVLQTRLRLGQQARKAPFPALHHRLDRGDSCRSVVQIEGNYGAIKTPSVPPNGNKAKGGRLDLLSEPQASLQGQPFCLVGEREVWRSQTGAAGRASLVTFLSRNKKVTRPPGRDPAILPRSPQQQLKTSPTNELNP